MESKASTSWNRTAGADSGPDTNDDVGKPCSRCRQTIRTRSSRVKCEWCKANVHVNCLTCPLPTPVLGDNFFILTCKTCSSSNTDIVKRDKVNWLQALVIALYNLKNHSPEMAREEYFHWKIHVASFLEKHWVCLFGPQMKKRKTWLGTISGTMSHWSGVIFRSGLSTLKESGWWRLMKDFPPEDLIASVPSSINRNVVTHKQPSLLAPPPLPEPERKRTRGVECSIAKAMALKEKRSSIGGGPSMPTTSSANPPPKKARTSSKETDSKDWFNIQSGADPGMDLEPSMFDDDSAVSADAFEGMLFSECDLPQSPSAVFRVSAGDCSFSVDESLHAAASRDGMIDDCSVDEIVSASRDSFPNVEELVSRLTSTTSSPARMATTPASTAPATPSGRRSPFSSQASSNVSYDDATCDDDKSSLDLERSDKENAKVTNDVSKSSHKPRKVNLPVEDEDKLHKFLDENIHHLDASRHKDIHHLKRKLDARRAKRAKGSKVSTMLDKTEVDKMRVYDVVRIEQAKVQTTPTPPSKQASPAAKTGAAVAKSRILDRYQMVLSGNQGQDDFAGCPFRTRLMGRDSHDLKPVKSPFTGRLLKPYIRRDFTTEPLKLKLLREIVQRNRPGLEVERHPIDYVYVRPNHIPSINHLAGGFFWPGIDLSECLQFPDFSCVAVYKKIVIGFAFLVPDVSYVDAYVSFIFTHPEWRRVGIAKFMLYHLIQTCMGKDITLHVSPTNPAVLLYQKFGFKVEETVTNFYDKFLPPGSKDCKHALFLRLAR